MTDAAVRVLVNGVPASTVHRVLVQLGLNRLAYAAYSATGILPRSMIHSPMPSILRPSFVVPAGTA